MNRIAELLPEAHILLDLEATTKKRLFEQIAQLFEERAQLSRPLVLDSLSARERLGSTGLGQGIAIPHGRIKGLKHTLGAFVRPNQPIAFDAPDGRPVTQVFVLLVPEQATEEHLQLLSELAQMFSDKAFRDRVTAATDASGLHELFTNWVPEPQ
jgi:PTS system nitrogen regulatory IIA component